MPCYHPIDAHQGQAGTPLRFGLGPMKGEKLDLKPVQIACGQCIGCRDKRARDWALRCMHEASLYEKNCFITLTYNKDNLPDDYSLHYAEFQEFMKRLRFHHRGHRPVAGDTYLEPWNVVNQDKLISQFPYTEIHWPIRFYMCGEYGSDFGRPHFHALLFNFDFEDKTFWKKTPAGEVIYRSKSLESLWTGGFSSVGTVTFKSAAYVARYIDAKITGDMADDHYTFVNPETGEIFHRTPEFNKMSLKPGIGAEWLKKYKTDVFPNDYVVVRGGQKVPVPKYYQKIYKCENPFEWDEVEYQRYINSRKNLDDNTPERLQIKKQVHLARKSKLKRQLT